jgi:hypothetical protein
MRMTLEPARWLILSLTAAALSLSACGADDPNDDASDDADDRGSDDDSDRDDDPFANADSGEAGDGGRAGATGGGAQGGGSGGADAPADGGGGADRDAGANDGGAGSEADAATGDGGGTPGGPMGTQPIGTLCANDGNCSQAMGEAVCCVNTCELVQDCPESPGYLPCDSVSDCEAFGGGKVCCELGEDRFCTKRSACTGEELP